MNLRPSLVVLFAIYAFLLQLIVFKACFNNGFNEFISLSRFLKYFSKNVGIGWIVRWVCLQFFSFRSTDLYKCCTLAYLVFERLRLWHKAYYLIDKANNFSSIILTIYNNHIKSQWKLLTFLIYYTSLVKTNTTAHQSLANHTKHQSSYLNLHISQPISVQFNILNSQIQMQSKLPSSYNHFSPTHIQSIYSYPYINQSLA